MGASGSKASRAAGSAARQYPNRPAPAPPSAQSATNAPPQPPPAPNHEPGPTVKPQARATGSRDEAINLDASDPDFAQSLRSIGPVQPNPTLSPTSAFPNPGNPNKNLTQAPRPLGPKPRENPTLVALDSRAKLQEAADAEFQMAGKRGHEGRQFLDVYMIRQILIERDVQGRSAEEIERKMGLKRGVVERLGGKGIVQLAQEQGRGQRGVEISSNRVAMAGAEALLQQLLQNQTRILARLDTVDEKLENLKTAQDQLSASQHQLSTEVRETREAQNDVAVKVAALRTHFHNPAGQRLVDTPELLEMILLQLDECPDEESRMDESDDESDDCDEYTGKLFDPKIHKQVLGLRTLLLARRVSRGFQTIIDHSKKLQRAFFFTPEPPTYTSRRINWLYLVTQVCHGLYIKCDEDPEARPHLALEARADSEGWCHIMFDIEDSSNLPVVSESVPMSDAEALSQQLLRTQLQTPTRLDILDKEVENLTASHNQLPAEVRDAHETQNDAATEVRTLRTQLYDSAVARLINTTELLEMILLEVVDLSPDVDEVTKRESCGENCGEKCVEYWGDIPCEVYSTFTDSKTGSGRGVFLKIDEKALRLRTLLLARRVSKSFRATIDGSSSLQQALFLTPNPPACASVRINWLYLTRELYHKIAWKKDESDSAQYIVPETSTDTRHHCESNGLAIVLN
ncbi:hypothetical protein KC340_g7160 [Hortaea werneckii]|nr:hypothetical protein KC342_g7577 [Hortaea werneckii]KAI7097653.1 hypothetical protein KC339_g9543 [Hortaea werneckii]KAI7236097.1 hypothetical protein KC365_g5300 [Hortaea werneckii]KAI7322055.1 hypothetical protein KC340_g7160 [Hortaea werneckii]KAI7398884.1 hypothetical protein KC328_g4263 [Hortaea werneckii]